MDGTFGGGDLISASLAIMLGGDDDAELHDKEVSLTTSDVTGSQTAVFEYDPENEPVSGTPAGPWDGYSLFTIDLSGVKDDLEDLQQQVSDLEDALEDCHDCWEEVVAALQVYDPDYDPDEGECPAPKVGEIVDHAKDCDDCKAEVIAKLQEYDPDFDPQTCEDIVDKIDEIEEEAEKPEEYTFEQDTTSPTYPDPDWYDKIAELIGGDPLTDNDLHIIVKPMDDRYPITPQGLHNVYYGFYDSVTGAFIGRTSAYQGGLDLEHTDYVSNFHITDPSTGTYTFDWVNWEYLYNPPEWGWVTHTYTETSRNLIGYGDPTHSYTVKNR